jgi:putative membrane protein
MMYGYGYGPGAGGVGFWMIGMWLFGVLLLVGIVLVVVWAVRRSGGPHAAGPGAHMSPSQDAAMMVARERLAKGEITPEEFETISRALRG